EGYLLDIMPRKNELLRPPIVNLDQGILVFSAVEPAFGLLLLDRLLVRFEAAEVAPSICITKMDLADGGMRAKIERYADGYRSVGYDVVLTSVKAKEGIDRLGSLLTGKTTVFT